MKTGRPTKYKPEYCQELIDYFNKIPQTNQLFEDQNGKPHQVFTPVLYPTFERWCADRSLNCETLKEWSEIHPDFSEAYTRAKQLQKDILLVNGASELYNSQFAKFIAINCHGMVDRQEVEMTGKIDMLAAAVFEVILDYVPINRKEECAKRIKSLINGLS